MKNWGQFYFLIKNGIVLFYPFFYSNPLINRQYYL